MCDLIKIFIVQILNNKLSFQSIDLGWQRRGYDGGQLGRRRGVRQSREPPVDVQECLVRFQEEVAAEADVGEVAVNNVQVHDHKLAAGHFVFTVAAGGGVAR